MLTKNERIDLLYHAQVNLKDAISSIREALEGTTHEHYANAYIIGHLKSWIDSEGSYDMGIEQYIEALEKGELEEEEDEDEE